MIVRLVISAAVLAVMAVGSVAMALTPDPGWKGAGWYAVVHDIGGGEFIATGPYPSEEVCKAQRPAPEDEYEYLECEYMGAQPYWKD